MLDTTIFKSFGFDEIVVEDFEFEQKPGGLPWPTSAVIHELVSGRRLRYFRDELATLREVPYDVGPRTLFFGYYAPAEFLCHLVLGWKLPTYCIDVFSEFRNLTNGLLVWGNRLPDALRYFGVESKAGVIKNDMRQRIMQGEPFTLEERTAIIDYNEYDVDDTTSLASVLLPKLDIPRAILRGHYPKAVAHKYFNGIPIDTTAHRIMVEMWPTIRRETVHKLDAPLGICSYWTNKFIDPRFERLLERRKIPWEYTESGKPRLDKATIMSAAEIYPELAPIRDLRIILGKLNLGNLAIGPDGRNRTMLSEFGTVTGRSQPRTHEYLLTLPKFLRGFGRAEPGHTLINMDIVQEEFGIAASLSGDENMIRTYQAGDVYLG